MMPSQVTKIAEETLSILADLKTFKISYITLFNKYPGKHSNRPEAPPTFLEVEEAAFVKSLIMCEKWISTTP